MTNRTSLPALVQPLNEHPLSEKYGAVTLDQIEPSAPPDPIIGRLDPLGHTILYGTGGVGKGTLAAHWIGQMLRIGYRVLILDYENHQEEWVRRLYGLGYGDFLANVLWVAPLSRNWPRIQGEGTAIWDQINDILSIIAEFDPNVVVIDSIVQACVGADAAATDTPARYNEALEKIERPVLSLAHVPKQGSAEYPFGSVYWHNLARMTWSLGKKGDTTILTNRKHNNYPKTFDQAIEVFWDGGMPRNLEERRASDALADRIERLIDTPMTATAITDALNEDIENAQEKVKSNSILAALRRGAERKDGRDPRFDVRDKKWFRYGDPGPADPIPAQEPVDEQLHLAEAV